MEDMAPGVTLLRAFLSGAKTALQKAISNKSGLKIVIGNESADLDSITSSIVYAYLRSAQRHTTSSSTVYIPLLNIFRKDIAIRPELTKLLDNVNISHSDLIALDDLELQSSSSSKIKPENTSWTLVDHNVLTGELGKRFHHRVVGCIDHHDDERQITASGGEPHLISKVGSCTSLVVNYCKDSWESLSVPTATSDEDEISRRQTWHADIAKLALASILVDTQNMTSVSKVTRADEDAVEYLLAKIGKAQRLQSEAAFDRDEFFREIDAAKKDLSALSVQDILRKDYKQWNEKGGLLGISSVAQPLSYMIDKTESDNHSKSDLFYATLETFAQERNLSAYAIMTAFSESTFERELLLYTQGEGMSSFKEKVADQGNSELGLEEWKSSTKLKPSGEFKIWSQTRLDKSRKQVGPFLRALM